MPVGQVYLSLGGFYDVACDGKIYRTRARGNFRVRRIKPIVGDWVSFKAGYMLAVKKRQNALLRPPVANVSQAIVVTSVQMPVFSSGLLDRQLVALSAKHIRPLIYFSKMDLLDAEKQKHFTALAQAYRKIGYHVLAPTKPFSETDLQAVKAYLPHHETVVMGQTGAGKSTLLNHLKPGLDLKTGEVSKTLHRGKHTTRRVHLIPMNDGLIADTPGFSAYDISGIDIYHLKNHFPEFVKASVNCKFRECLHLKEPKCAVKAAVKAGQILKSRYHNYVDLYQIIKNQKPIYHKKK